MVKLKVTADLCTGCMNCQAVCTLEHNGFHNRSASSIRVNLELFSGVNTITWCRQCEKPECLEVCPSDSITRDKVTGAWKVNSSTCLKCGLCVDACPFGAMFQTEPETVPFKCDLCGGNPSCVDACNFGAITLEEYKP